MKDILLYGCPDKCQDCNVDDSNINDLEHSECIEYCEVAQNYIECSGCLEDDLNQMPSDKQMTPNPDGNPFDDDKEAALCEEDENTSIEYRDEL